MHTIIAAAVPVGLLLDLGSGLQEFWLLGALFAVGLLKVAQDLVRRNRKAEEDQQGPLLVVGTAEPHPISSLPDRPRRPSPRPREHRPDQWRSRGLPAPVLDETSETIRVPTGDDGRLEFLPGRLEVVRGAEVGREFHFLRVPGQSVPEVTVGRSHGPPHRHVQIPAPTVSRLHAMLRFEDRCWCIANLSTTNPVRVNGTGLSSPDATATLSDGDRIELGEVELRYRETRL